MSLSISTSFRDEIKIYVHIVDTLHRQPCQFIISAKTTTRTLCTILQPEYLTSELTLSALGHLPNRQYTAFIELHHTETTRAILRRVTLLSDASTTALSDLTVIMSAPRTLPPYPTTSLYYSITECYEHIPFASDLTPHYLTSLSLRRYLNAHSRVTTNESDLPRPSIVLDENNHVRRITSSHTSDTVNAILQLIENTQSNTATAPPVPHEHNESPTERYAHLDQHIVPRPMSTSPPSPPHSPDLSHELTIPDSPQAISALQIIMRPSSPDIITDFRALSNSPTPSSISVYHTPMPTEDEVFNSLFGSRDLTVSNIVYSFMMDNANNPQITHLTINALCKKSFTMAEHHIFLSELDDTRRLQPDPQSLKPFDEPFLISRFLTFLLRSHLTYEIKLFLAKKEHRCLIPGLCLLNYLLTPDMDSTACTAFDLLAENYMLHTISVDFYPLAFLEFMSTLTTFRAISAAQVHSRRLVMRYIPPLSRD